jgi:hypothetical protein
MLKTIAPVSPESMRFVEALNLPLNTSQHRHVVGNPCPKSTADTFRQAPWRAEDSRTPLRRHMIQIAFETAETQRIPKKEDHLTFRTNIQIARAMLEAVKPLIPDECDVYLTPR